MLKQGLFTPVFGTPTPCVHWYSKRNPGNSRERRLGRHLQRCLPSSCIPQTNSGRGIFIWLNRPLYLRVPLNKVLNCTQIKLKNCKPLYLAFDLFFVLVIHSSRLLHSLNSTSMCLIFFTTATLGDREDSSNPILMVRKVRLPDLTACLKVTHLHPRTECILNPGLLKYFSLNI